MIVRRQSKPVHLEGLGWVNFVMDAVNMLKASDAGHYAPTQAPPRPEVSPWVWAGLGVGGVVLIGGLAFAFRKR